MGISAARQSQILDVCMRQDLRTYDPYDIWMTPLGVRIKDLFNRRRKLALVPAALLTLFDTYVNDRWRVFYRAREYPIVRAWAALILMNLDQSRRTPEVLDRVREHLVWLRDHTCQGYHGPCWGLGFHYAVMPDYHYDSNMPLTTMSQYPLEAFVLYAQLTGSDEFDPVIRGVFEFLKHDVKVMEETDEYIATSYAAFHDRKVINAVSYVMFSYALLLPYLDDLQASATTEKIRKLYRYIADHQKADGSWLYSPEGKSFIDCYHSCIVLKNIIKTDRVLALPGSREIVARGYQYVKDSFRVADKGLFKRFALANKPALVRYDLYDNAEMLSMAVQMGDRSLAEDLETAIERHFVSDNIIYSHIDSFGLRHGPNRLRWAMLPYFHALTRLTAMQAGGSRA